MAEVLCFLSIFYPTLGEICFLVSFSSYIEDKRKYNLFSKMSFMASFSGNITHFFLTMKYIFVVKAKIFMNMPKQKKLLITFASLLIYNCRNDIAIVLLEGKDVQSMCSFMQQSLFKYCEGLQRLVVVGPCHQEFKILVKNL